MELGFLVLADAAEALNGKLYALGAGWNMLRLTNFPQAWEFGVGLGLDVPWAETNRRHVLEMRFDDPDGEHISEPFRVDFEVGRPPGAHPGQDQRMVIAVNTNQTFERVGPHAVVVSVDDHEVDRTRFYVVEVPGAPSIAA
jgi:hypothetical protein